jgi:hypothetical protein
MSDPSQIDQDQNRVERPLEDDSHTVVRDAASLDVVAGSDDSEIIPALLIMSQVNPMEPYLLLRLSKRSIAIDLPCESHIGSTPSASRFSS